MPLRNILCVNLGRDACEVVAHLVNSGWEVTQASTLAAAGRLQALRHFPVSLLIMEGKPPAPDGALGACVRTSRGSEWVAVCDNQALDSTEFRDLLLGDFFGYQTLPLDWQALDLLLRNASQRAALRDRHTTQAHAAETLGMVGKSPAIQRLRQQIRKVATNTAPVLIGGESGSGKELAAQAIHHLSARSAEPFIAVNCGAIAPSLIHAELFGHERGAFTGASAQRSGLIEAAHHGTIFLDEIADLPLDLQTNLLRFLQEKTINRVGSVRSLHVDARVVAASHTKLADAVAMGRFREDLFYRINVLPIEVPPLRSRMEDVPLLAAHFLQQCADTGSTRVEGFRRHAMAAMLAYDWPGNVRELHNRVQRAAVMADQHLVSAADLGLEAIDSAFGGLHAARTTAERDAICLTLSRVGSNVTLAARELGVSRMTLYRLMEKHSIAPHAETHGPV